MEKVKLRRSLMIWGPALGLLDIEAVVSGGRDDGDRRGPLRLGGGLEKDGDEEWEEKNWVEGGERGKSEEEECWHGLVHNGEMDGGDDEEVVERGC
jgi:hypothetical protein